ncbi:MAG TPA: hypothetical protein VHQ39_12590 [Dongiaceae bacterium]|nr:hypothetical protein [Dongiaceae bacterium]
MFDALLSAAHIPAAHIPTGLIIATRLTATPPPPSATSATPPTAALATVAIRPARLIALPLVLLGALMGEIIAALIRPTIEFAGLGCTRYGHRLSILMMIQPGFARLLAAITVVIACVALTIALTVSWTISVGLALPIPLAVTAMALTIAPAPPATPASAPLAIRTELTRPIASALTPTFAAAAFAPAGIASN